MFKTKHLLYKALKQADMQISKLQNENKKLSDKYKLENEKVIKLRNENRLLRRKE